MSTHPSISRAALTAAGAALLAIASPACTQTETPQDRTFSVERDRPPPVPPAAAIESPSNDRPAHADARLVLADQNEVELADATIRARAVVQPTTGNDVRGTVDFFFTPAAMTISVNLTGLKPGTHGFHIHETGDCSAADASSAGSHLNPDNRPHGAPTEPNAKHHAGDLGNIRADNDGTSKQWLRNEQLQLDGPTGILGRAIVIHAHNDDLETQPSGASGNPVACGVIQASSG